MIPGIVSSFSRAAPPAASFAGVVSALNPLSWFRFAETSGSVAANSGTSGVGAEYIGSVLKGRPSLCGDTGDFSAGFTDVHTRVQSTSLSYPFNDESSEFSIIVMIKPDSVSGLHAIFSHGTDRPYLRISDGTLQWLSSQSAFLGSFADSVSAGNRYLIGISVAVGGATAFYINGEPSGTANGSFTNSSLLQIGTENGNFDAFVGDIDEWAYFPSLLTPAQHAMLWAAVT